MAAIETTQATRDDCVALAPVMREADVQELRASVGSYPLTALIDGLAQSAECWAVRFDGELACIWGVSPAVTLGIRVGCIWMLTGEAVEHHKAAFWSECCRVLPELFERYDVLVNAIDVRHTRAIKWGKRLGFQFQPPKPWGVEGRDFCAFRVTKEDVACALLPQSPR